MSDRQNETPPLVSVHVITYNQAAFIRDTLDSILAQDYRPLEIVVADDGSTDGTAEVVLDYAARFPGVVVPLVHGPNLGITGNSNRGLRRCSGHFIAFMGGDDLMLPGKLSRQVATMVADRRVAVCYHNLEVFDSDSGRTLSFMNEAGAYSGDCAGYVRLGTTNGGSATMVRADCVPAGGFDPALPVASDWLFWVQALMARNGRIVYIDETLGRYRRHGGNVTNSASPLAAQGLRDSLATCTRIILDYPALAPGAFFRMGTILRGERHRGDYLARLLSSWHASRQWKTGALILAHLLSFGRLKP